jgi:endogenous inhibitor of DNA gyrase (YacG/DUF329 family)
MAYHAYTDLSHLQHPLQNKPPAQGSLQPGLRSPALVYTRGEIIICPVCGKEFIPAHHSDCTQRACSSVCGAILRARTETLEQRQKRSNPLPPLIVTCRVCGKIFTDPKRRKTREYCSRRCASLGKAGSNRGWVPDESWRDKASARMHARNPSRDPEAREKMNAAMRGRKFAGERGGNGQ